MSSRRILLVDDESNVLRACQRLLRRHDFEIEVTQDAIEALKKLADTEFDVVVSDQRMPNMEGTEFLSRATEVSPETVRVMLTGYADINASIAAINQGKVFRFLTKPWDDEHYVRCIEDASAFYRLRKDNRRLQELTIKQNEELSALNSDLEARVLERTAKVEELNTSLRGSLMGAIRILSQVSERYSASLGDHARRVSSLSLAIGRRMKLSGHQISQLQIASMLHDIGKIGLDPHVLNTPAVLRNRMEREHFESHAERGEQIIQLIPNFADAARYVRQHHEKLNGHGYPDRLENDQIDLCSQIISVADHFDHLMNDPVLSDSRSLDQALETISQKRGKWYREDVVDALFESQLHHEAPPEIPLFVAIHPADLKTGMILAEDLRSTSGALWLPAGERLDSLRISQIRRLNDSHPLGFELKIDRASLPQEPDDVAATPTSATDLPLTVSSH